MVFWDLYKHFEKRWMCRLAHWQEYSGPSGFTVPIDDCQPQVHAT